MKKTLLSLCAFCFTLSLFAQDVCAELMTFNDFKKNVNRTYRITSKTEMFGQTIVIEHDSKGRAHQLLTMEVREKSIKMETYLVDKDMYIKKDGGDWAHRSLDSSQMVSIMNQWKNNQLQFFKNCQKFADTIELGKKYRVYSAEFDIDQMIDKMDKSAQLSQNFESMRDSDMKMTFFINDKDDVEKTKLHMLVRGREVDSDMFYEYDIPIHITLPAQLPSAEKKD